jgi:hypothetical protein
MRQFQNGLCASCLAPDSIKSETATALLFVVFDRSQLNRLPIDSCNDWRSHWERGHLPPLQGEKPDEVTTLQLHQIEMESYVRGRVKSFQWKAA